MCKMRTNRKRYSTYESQRDYEAHEYDTSNIPTYEDLMMKYNLKGLRGEYRYEAFKERFLDFYSKYVVNHMMKAEDFKSPLYPKQYTKTIIKIIIDSFVKTHKEMVQEYRNTLADFNILRVFNH